MDEAERLVRETWAFVYYYYREDACKVKCGAISGGFNGSWCVTADEAWSAALAFTLERLREIRIAQRGLVWLRLNWTLEIGTPYEWILALIKDKLAALSQGIRPEALTRVPELIAAIEAHGAQGDGK